MGKYESEMTKWGETSSWYLFAFGIMTLIYGIISTIGTKKNFSNSFRDGLTVVGVMVILAAIAGIVIGWYGARTVKRDDQRYQSLIQQQDNQLEMAQLKNKKLAIRSSTKSSYSDPGNYSSQSPVQNKDYSPAPTQNNNQTFVTRGPGYNKTPEYNAEEILTF